MSAELLDVLVLDARLRQSLVAVRSLGRAGMRVGVAEASGEIPPASRSRWSTMVATLPDVADGRDPFVDGVLWLLARHPARVLMTAHDGSIEAIRSRRVELEPRVAVALASDPALGSAIDKRKTLEAAEQVGVPVPRGSVVQGPSDVGDVLDMVGLPAVVKPLRSWSSAGNRGQRSGARDIVSLEEGRGAVERILESGGTPLVQEWLPGRREAVSLMRADRRIYAEFAQVAYRTDPPIGGASVLRESIAVPADLADFARRLVEHLDLDGYAEVEFRRDAAGRAVLMEVNPRLSASVEIAVRCGVDFPALLWRWAAKEPLAPVNGYRLGVRMRWLGGDFSWLRDSLRRPGRPDTGSPLDSVRQFVGDFLRPTGYDYVDASDPRPAWTAGSTALARVAHRAVGHWRRPGVGPADHGRNAGLDAGARR